MNTFNVSTASPFSSTVTEIVRSSDYATRGPPTANPSKIYESGEDLIPEILDEEDDDEEEELETEAEDDDVEGEDDELDDEAKDVLKMDEAQVDNQLVPEIPRSKFEKLAEECRRPGYQLPCKIGQKWYCQMEDRRWRRHKCKQQVQLPSVNKIFKKCACFTQKGLVYKKVPVSTYIYFYISLQLRTNDTYSSYVYYRRKNLIIAVYSSVCNYNIEPLLLSTIIQTFVCECARSCLTCRK